MSTFSLQKLRKKFKDAHLIILVIVILGLFASGFALAQYDYYDPYSNSNIDYFPSNPLPAYKSPSPTQSSGGTSGSTSGGTTSGGTTNTTTNTTVTCANKAIANPQNTRSVEIRDKSGKVFYLSPPKEELIGIKAYPETSLKIYKIIYNTSGVKEDEKEIGLITVSNKCYPKYGYVQNSASVTASVTTPSVSSSSVTPSADSTTVPENATGVNLDPVTGKVYNAKTGVVINDARYDVVARKIFYKDTNSTYGKVFTDTTGYVNIDLRGLSNTAVSPPPTVAPTKSDYDYDYNYNYDYGSPKKTPEADTYYDIPAKTTPKKNDASSGNTSSSSISDASTHDESEDETTGDQDFDLLDINVGGEELEEVRAEVATDSQTGKTNLRGWNPGRKEEIVARPENVKTTADLKVYVEAVALNDEALKSVKVKKDTVEMESRESGKLLGFIPVRLSSTVTVKYDLRGGAEEQINIRLPWWHIFVKKSYSPNTLKSEIAERLRTSEAKKMSDPMPQDEMSHVSQILKLVSSIMKTKHETTGN